MSAIEVGFLLVGHRGIDTYSDGRPYERFMLGPNKFNGVGVSHKIYNASDKTIKYITFTYIPYNAVGDVIKCQTSGKSEVSAKLTGPLQPNEEAIVEFDALWYNPTIKKAVIKEVVIQYMDNSKDVISGENLKSMVAIDSTYNAKIGTPKKIEAEQNNTVKKAYISFMVLTCLKNVNDSESSKHHINQGLILFVLEVFAVLLNMIGSILPVLVGYLLGFISTIIWLYAIGCSIYGYLSAAAGKQWKLPLFGGIKLIK